MKNIVVIIGSASKESANLKLMKLLESQTQATFKITIFDSLKELPHFDPELSSTNPPTEIQAFRKLIQDADGVVICSPEYVFSIPSGLKNALEWCVATTVFSDKPMGLITASAQGLKGHEELQLIMQTLMANFTPETCLLIQGIKGKINANNDLTDEQTKQEFALFIKAFKDLTDV